MFCIYLRTNSDLYHLQHKLFGFYNRDEKCLQRGTDWVFKYSSLLLICFQKDANLHISFISGKLLHMFRAAYIGQTSRNLKQRYREHTCYIRNNDPQSSYAQHILQNRHECGSITDTMTKLKHINKKSMLTPTKNYLSKLFIIMEILSRNKAQVNKPHYFSWPRTQYLRQQPNQNRSIQFPNHTQTSSNSPTIAAGSSNGYVHTTLFDRDYCIFRLN